MQAGRGRAALAAAAAATLLAIACVSSDVFLIGSRRPARPAGCPVEVFPDTPPPYPFKAIAWLKADCVAGGRNACLEELRKQACQVGADSICDFTEGYGWIAATFAAHQSGADASTPGSPTTTKASPSSAVDCDPICSPGFACQAGRCIPQCNPPCEAGHVCSRKRICEAAGAPGK